MTRVWSLSREQTNDNQLYVVWKSNSKLLSFDSGYNSSPDTQSTSNFDTNFDAFSESDDYSNANEDNRQTDEDSTSTTSTSSATSLQTTQRVQRSSPIPIPRRNKNYGNIASKSSLMRGSEHSLRANTLSSLESVDSVHCLIGHPPYDCGCVRGYRYPFAATDTTAGPSHRSDTLPAPQSLTCADQREGTDTGVKKRYYPLPDIVSSSQNTTLMNEIIREIGCDLRRISKDFIATRNPNIESPKTSAITRLLRLAIPYLLKEVLQLF